MNKLLGNNTVIKKTQVIYVIFLQATQESKNEICHRTIIEKLYYPFRVINSTLLFRAEFLNLGTINIISREFSVAGSCPMH